MSAGGLGQGIGYPTEFGPMVHNRTKVETLKFRISKDCTVTIALDGDPTQQSITKLIQYLELVKDGYPLNLSTPVTE